MAGRVIAVLLLLGLSDGNVVFRDTASSRSAPPSSPATPTFNNSELECFIQQKVLHSDGKCYTIRHQGPCLEGQWLVLDKEERFVPNGGNRRSLVCKDMPCEQSPTRLFWPEDGQCHKQTDSATLCPFAGNELRRDSYGEGECACAKAYIRFKPEVLRGDNGTIVWDGACYPLYQQGPCSASKVLMAGYLEGFGPVGQCRADPCHSENSREPGTWYAHSAADRLCHKLGARGPCAEREKFKVNPLTNRAQCLGSGHTSLVLYGDSPMRCDGNLNSLTQECREEVKVVARSSPYATAVTGKRRPRRKAVPREEAEGSV